MDSSFRSPPGFRPQQARTSPRTVLQPEIVERCEDLERHEKAWRSLADHAIEPNPFYEPWIYLPASRMLDEPGRRFDLFFHAGSQMVGFFPLVAQDSCKGIPWKVLSLRQHPHAYSATPLVRRGLEDRVVNAFLETIAPLLGSRGVLRLPLFDHAGALGGLFLRAMERRHRAIYHDASFARPFMVADESAEAYLRRALSRRSRKRFEKQIRNLADLGKVEFVSLGEEEDAGPWIRSFLELEAAGWKGRQGTALASSPEGRTFFEEVVRRGRKEGKVLMNALRVGGRVIAQDVNFRAQRGLFAFKIAYDESFAACSPGIQLELHDLRTVHENPRLDWIDSCVSQPGSPLERIYRERRVMSTMILSAGGILANWFVRSLPLLRTLRNWTQRFAFLGKSLPWPAVRAPDRPG